jgi:hypothetical protein
VMAGRVGGAGSPCLGAARGIGAGIAEGSSRRGPGW